jgi:ferrous iron transport protein A
MTRKIIPLVYLNKSSSAKILEIQGGHGFHRRLNVLGIREGQIVRIISKQPLRGPITVTIGNTQITIGRGMASKILVEEL